MQSLPTPGKARAQSRADTIAALSRLLRDAMARDRFASTSALLIAVDQKFPSLSFADFVAAYFSATEHDGRNLQ